MSDERRQSPRVAARTEIKVRFPTWSLFSFLYTLDISRGGMLLEMPEEPVLGASLTVQLQPPTGAPIDLEAVVRHSGLVPTRPSGSSEPATRRFQVGVQFQNLDDTRRASIEALLKRNGAPPGSVGLKPKKT